MSICPRKQLRDGERDRCSGDYLWDRSGPTIGTSHLERLLGTLGAQDPPAACTRPARRQSRSWSFFVAIAAAAAIVVALLECHG